MGYIEELRAIVGHKPLILVGAVVFVVDALGRLLLHRRADNGAWGLPSGFLELGESIENAARREVWEETGLKVRYLTLWGVFSGPDFFYKCPNGDLVYSVIVAYTTRDFHGELRVNDTEGLDVRFYDLQNLPQEISPPVRPVLEQFLVKFKHNLT